MTIGQKNTKEIHKFHVKIQIDLSDNEMRCAHCLGRVFRKKLQPQDVLLGYRPADRAVTPVTTGGIRNCSSFASKDGVYAVHTLCKQKITNTLKPVVGDTSCNLRQDILFG